MILTQNSLHRSSHSHWKPAETVTFVSKNDVVAIKWNTAWDLSFNIHEMSNDGQSHSCKMFHFILWFRREKQKYLIKPCLPSDKAFCNIVSTPLSFCPFTCSGGDFYPESLFGCGLDELRWEKLHHGSGSDSIFSTGCRVSRQRAVWLRDIFCS